MQATRPNARNTSKRTQNPNTPTLTYKIIRRTHTYFNTHTRANTAHKHQPQLKTAFFATTATMVPTSHGSYQP
jgi:hypothetical protein